MRNKLTKRDLIDQLQALDAPDDTEVLIFLDHGQGSISVVETLDWSNGSGGFYVGLS